MACPMQRSIKALQRKLGLDDETYRAFLESVAGKRSTVAMTRAERWRVLEAFKAKGATLDHKTARGKKDADKNNSPQSRLVRHLWLELKKMGVLRDSSEWALLAYAERITGNKRLEWCDREGMDRLINSLRGWIVRAEAEAEKQPEGASRGRPLAV